MSLLRACFVTAHHQHLDVLVKLAMGKISVKSTTDTLSHFKPKSYIAENHLAMSAHVTYSSGVNVLN